MDDPKSCYINLSVNPNDPPQWEIRVDYEEAWSFNRDYPKSNNDSHEAVSIDTSEGGYSLGSIRRLINPDKMITEI